MKTKKEISKRIARACVICGKGIKIILYKDRTYRNGHYFGKIFGRRGKAAEYWECPKCYRRKND